MEKLKQKVQSNIAIDENGCWNWQRSLGTGGYGVSCLNSKRIYAHRLSYRAFKGEIPKGLCIDHLCRNRKCVNPDHLEAVTQKVNINRGVRDREPTRRTQQFVCEFPGCKNTQTRNSIRGIRYMYKYCCKHKYSRNRVTPSPLSYI